MRVSLSSLPLPDAGRLLAAFLLCLTAIAGADDEFTIDGVRTWQHDGHYYLNARLQFKFTDSVLEALSNGVPLTIVTHIQVRRDGAWLWEDSLLDRQLRQTIRYRPLSDSYQVYDLPRGTPRSFATREAAIRALGELQNHTLFRSEHIDPDEHYTLEIKVSLDIEQLPLPLRPSAYLKPSWKLSSGWTEWPLTP